ncbi:thiamine phosphate synthase [uncultured Helicobacter sp.]|uniref:thiamine phosphate synthase n=1 Tax=uncultured Helicobacter sp. TaxID=175537 RepID=UPI0025CE6058|nr:thiamine phosphate synthase [uncultured Helicobacter sp.]
MSINTKLQGIYAISDKILTPYEILSQCVESALKAGVRIFQLRDKSHSDEWLYPIAKKLLKLCERYNALFVLNDRLNLALKLQVPALHIGKDDGEFSRVRERFSGILGASSYGDLQRAKILESLGADYVAFGAFFPSPTKPNATLAPLELLPQAQQTLKIPICAIGGISTQNIYLLKNADMCAVISSLWANNSQDSSTPKSTRTNPTHTESTLQNRLDSIAHNAKALQKALHK